MKILLIGSSGAGKSTLARKLSELTAYPLLHLDKIWHTTDYSDQALLYFQQVQDDFMAAHDDWIIDGNYSGTMSHRIQQADVIIWLKISPSRAIFRVVSRSLKTRLSGHNRSDMASNFKEKFDHEYWDFMKFIWHFPKNNEPRITKLIEAEGKSDCVTIVKTQKDKAKIMSLYS